MSIQTISTCLKSFCQNSSDAKFCSTKFYSSKFYSSKFYSTKFCLTKYPSAPLARLRENKFFHSYNTVIFSVDGMVSMLRKIFCGLLQVALLCAILFQFTCNNNNLTFAQMMVNRVVPPLPYFTSSKRAFDQGDFPNALKFLTDDIKHSVKFNLPNGSPIYWIDSICFQTMIGECHYQMGNYKNAMIAFDMAIDIYMDQPDWLSKVTFELTPVLIPRPAAAWGVTTRKGGVGNFTNCKFRILQQSPRLAAIGGAPVITTQSSLTTIYADEIVTRLAIAVKRRSEILGPLSRFDERTLRLNKILATRPCPPNHFSGAWIDVLYGLTLSALGDYQMAIPQLEKSALMQGSFDHHLTPYALNELGKIALLDGKAAAAQNYFFEASLCATYFGDSSLIGETFSNIAKAQKLIDQTKPIPALKLALAYFSKPNPKTKTDPSPQILIPLLLEIADDALTTGDIKTALDACNRARLLIKSPYTTAAAQNLYLYAKIEYLNAIIKYSANQPFNFKAGDDNLVKSILINRRASLWMHHFELLELAFINGKVSTSGLISPHEANDLYENLLRDPTAIDWAIRPVDSITLMTCVDPKAYQRWFIVVSLMLADKEKAFDITELARRAAFYSILQNSAPPALQLTPRHLALRIMFEGTGDDVVDLQQERNMLAMDFAKFGQVSEKVRNIKKQLFDIPIVPKEESQIILQRNLLAELQTASAAQEIMLRPIALSRTKVSVAFPPIVKHSRLRQELPEKTALLLFYEDALGDMHGFLVDRHNIQSWVIAKPQREPALGQLITNYLESIGNKRDANSILTVKNDIIDSDKKWKVAGNILLQRLLGQDREVNFTELIVVPFGRLWYVPFESLTVKVGETYRPLISASAEPITVRYAPMASLAIPKKATDKSKISETLVIYGNLMGKNDSTAALDAIDRYTKNGMIKNIALAPSRESKTPDFPGTASAFATQVKQLIVLDDIPAMNHKLLEWSPFMNDKNRTKNPIASWLTLPWGGPQLVVLPAFHTPAETGLKTTSSSRTPLFANNGNDIFMTAMTLQACGAKTILISRWRPGGRSTFDLVGEFMKAYPEMPAPNAWRQAIMNVGIKKIEVEQEPRISITPKDETPLATHPFFWSPFILIDRGETTENKETDK
ncbi:MAG: CHAT domain-containing protein [Planctomycetaceae bacterium]|jgi:tetratricopeptide (TPR) repeat protein|nr:CHAT domain-containing protein [Planctomycetaceae bacterium]